MTQLEQLIAQQSDLLSQIKGLMARNPEKEFGQREGIVGANPLFIPPTKIEGFQGTPGVVAWTEQVACATIYPQFWHFEHRGFIGALSNSTLQVVASIQFDSEPSFMRPTKPIFRFYRRETWPLSYTANTGAVLYTLSVDVPSRYRCARVQVANLGSGSQAFATTDVSAIFTGGQSLFSIEAFGE